jgi:phytoene dehydrogenase-like protein
VTLKHVTIAGGGLAGLVAAVTAAEAGAAVTLYEAHATLGGRARTSPAPWLANEGPHVVYADGPLWAWLAQRGLTGDAGGVPLRGLAGARFRHRGRRRAVPPAGIVRMLAAKRATAPVGEDFRTWATGRWGPETAAAAASMAGVFSYDADPGRLSAAFVWERLTRVFTTMPPAARYLPGGWGGMIGRLAAHADGLAVRIETSARVDELPAPPLVVATGLHAAARLLGEPLAWPSGDTALLDVGLRKRRGDAFLISDLDEAGWLEAFSLADPGLAPPGHALVQVQLPPRPGEDRAATTARLERLLELGSPGWADRLTWRRDAVARGRTGALDLPGTTWRDRPAVERGGGVFLAGDQVAAPGLLGEVSLRSARRAAALACAELGLDAAA